MKRSLAGLIIPIVLCVAWEGAVRFGIVPGRLVRNSMKCATVSRWALVREGNSTPIPEAGCITRTMPSA